MSNNFVIYRIDYDITVALVYFLCYNVIIILKLRGILYEYLHFNVVG